MDNITFNDFQKLDIRIAKIIDATEIEGADKLYKITLDVGSPEENGLGERVVAAGIKEFYSLEDLKGKLVPYLANLEPKNIRGVESQGMLLAASEEHGGGPILLHPDKKVKPGAIVR